MKQYDKVASKNVNLDKKIEIKNNQKSQTRKMKEEAGYIEAMEDVSKYGEFVSSYFAWVTLEGQKDRVKEMENMTKKKQEN